MQRKQYDIWHNIIWFLHGHDHSIVDITSTCNWPRGECSCKALIYKIQVPPPFLSIPLICNCIQVMMILFGKHYMCSTVIMCTSCCNHSKQLLQGGLGTREEMCISFLLHYPRMEMSLGVSFIMEEDFSEYLGTLP